MNAFIFTFIMLFFSMVGEILLTNMGMIFPLTAVMVFYLAISRHPLIVFPLVCIAGVMLDNLLVYPFMLNSIYLLIVAIIGVLWLINGEFSYGSLPHSTVIAIVSNCFIMTCYIVGLIEKVQYFNFSLFADIMINIGINSFCCYIFMPLISHYADKVATSLEIAPFSMARVNYIQKDKEL